MEIDTAPAASRLMWCARCSNAFEDERRRSGRHKRFCSEECRRDRRAEQNKRYRLERRYPSKPRNKIHGRSCAVCATSFKTENLRTICCSRTCGLAWSAAKGAAWSRENRKYQTRGDRDRLYAFRRRSVTEGREAEKFPAAEIFERDGWLCQLCGQEVDRDLKWPHPKSASLDHATPIACGGQHVRSNCQLAHLGCNSRKGAGLGQAPVRPNVHGKTWQASF